MKPWAKVLMAVLFLAMPASLPAAQATFEIDILQESWTDLGHPQTADLAEPALRKLHDRRPIFTVRAEDVESYLWQTQRITLTREASTRLTDLIRRQWPSMAAIGDEPSWEWCLHDQVFLVRLDGEVLYGGLFINPDSAKSVGYPVIHPEVVDEQGIFYLLPRHMYPGKGGDFEETGGSSRWFVRSYRKDLDPFDPGSDEDPEMLRFRRLFRDTRVRDLFANLGKLVPAPLPPRTPEEIRTALLQTDHEVDLAFANGSSVYTGGLLADSYKRVPPFGPWLDKEEILADMRDGSWDLPFYAVMAKEEPVLTDDRRAATLRSLVGIRGILDGYEVDTVTIATRRYDFTGEKWLLRAETHEKCADDDPRWRAGTIKMISWYLEPCWPPAEPPRPDPRLDRVGELPGAGSPQEVMAKMAAAAAAGDYGAVMNLVEPAARRRLAAAKLGGAYLRISSAETNAAANASIAAQEPYFTAEERADAARESDKEAKRAAELRQRLASLLSGFGITLDLAPATPAKDIPRGEALEALIDNADQGKLIAALDEFLFPDDPPLAAPGPEAPPEVTDYRIAGDRATARSGDHVLNFVRIDGRWYSLPPPLPEISEPSKIP